MALAKNEPLFKLDIDIVNAITNCVIDRLRAEEKASVKEQYDKRLASTKILLRNYRSLSAHCENAVYDAINIEADIPLFGLLALMATSSESDTLKIESIRKSTVRTQIMVNHVNAMISLYRSYCERSANPEDRRRYRVIYDHYIAEIPLSQKELAIEENVELRTIQRDLKIATERLTAMIFGIDGLYFQGA